MKPPADCPESFTAFVQAKVSADREGKIQLEEGYAAYQAFASGRGDEILSREAFAEALREVAISARGVRVEDRFLGLTLG